MIKNILAISSLAFVLGVGSLPVQAQNSAPAPSTPGTSQKPATPGTSQPSVSDEELQKFVGVARKLDSISKERNTLVVQAIEKEGMKVDRFREIYVSKQDPQAKPAQISNEEQQKYDRALAQLVQIQKDTQAKMGNAVQSEGLEVPRFIQILEAVQKTPTLQKKIEQMMKPAGTQK
ncbi:DUF4168 domain-containing protein [Leptodesmis sichuanensis]|uniref:DUF4168 domain-containing protein n=1 Tax=Leptodesmis sichuanensis TaxID=2906798 RepID=UPI001F24D12E|nr:DUF4168 domain-containing protein [Leptodesmis sichuanensis]UIE39090.1 DUF4168 domain-containing protein [Leptodesmis sichuanensis A121]